jgi:hypothetical protein
VIFSFVIFPSHIVASLSAFIRSVEYASNLKIRGKEWNRYLKKSISLGLCYAGFSPTGRIREAWGAGEAAFLCCAYDVVTDWRHFDPKAREAYERILRSMKLDLELQFIAIDLYEKELFKRLEEDGLDRGYIALRFTLKMMGCEKACEEAWGDVDEVGRLCQIVDDVLDYEQDIVWGDTNCLTSPRREDYLKQLISKFGSSETHRLFGKSRTALVIAIEKARSKAEVLIRAEGSIQETVNATLRPVTADSSVAFTDALKIETPRR